MEYEVYADVLSGLLFLYHLIVLEAINRKMNGLTRPLRRLSAAFLGTVLAVLFLVLPVAPLVKNLFFLLVNPLIMLVIAYPIRQLQGLEYLCKYYCMYTIFLGAGFLGIKNMISLFGFGYSLVLLFAFGIAGVIWYRRRKHHSMVKVELYLGDERFLFDGFIDTGNTLMEPFSKKGVNVLVTDNEEAKNQLIKGRGYVVPYRTIGTGNGILMGYLVHKMSVISNGLEKKYEDVLVAVSPQKQEGEFVILSGLIAEK